MNIKNLTFGLVIAAAIVATGCSGSAEATTETKPEVSSSETQTVAMTKCAGCGVEKPTAELKMDHGQLQCEACIAAHGH